MPAAVDLTVLAGKVHPPWPPIAQTPGSGNAGVLSAPVPLAGHRFRFSLDACQGANPVAGRLCASQRSGH